MFGSFVRRTLLRATVLSSSAFLSSQVIARTTRVRCENDDNNNQPNNSNSNSNSNNNYDNTMGDLSSQFLDELAAMLDSSQSTQTTPTRAPTVDSTNTATNATNTTDITQQNATSAPSSAGITDTIYTTVTQDPRANVLDELWALIKSEGQIEAMFTESYWKSLDIWNKLIHKINLSYPHSNEINRCIDSGAEIMQDEIFMNDARYALRHAIACYPHFGLVPFLSTDEARKMALFSTHQEFIAHLFNLDSNKDIVKSQLNLFNDWLEPNYYLCVDHKTKKIVLCIRGTLSIGDILTDVSLHSRYFDANKNKYTNRGEFIARAYEMKEEMAQKWREMRMRILQRLSKVVEVDTGKYGTYGAHTYAHDGMLASAKWLYDNVSDELRDLCNKYPNYECIICGHSLGAGVASLLGLLYKYDKIVYKQNKLKVFSFASPCIASLRLAEQGNDYINSFIIDCDIVSRLSLQSVLQMHNRLELIQFILNQKESESIKAKKHSLEQLSKDINDVNSDISSQIAVRGTATKNNDENEKMTLDSGKIFSNFDHLLNELDKWRDCTVELGEQIIKDCLTDGDNNIDRSNDLLQSLTEMPLISKHEQLFPVGRVLWFVPQNREINKDNSIDKNDGSWMPASSYMPQSFKFLFDSNVRKETMAAEDDKSGYILCDATDHRTIFQHLHAPMPESLLSHLPPRYFHCFDTQL